MHDAALVFDRGLAYGRRLNVPSGSSVRFEPGESKVVTLVDIAGHRIVGMPEHLKCVHVVDSKLSLMSKSSLHTLRHTIKMATESGVSPSLSARSARLATLLDNHRQTSVRPSIAAACHTV